jgi:sugar phosphate isomerase/epimerase
MKLAVENHKDWRAVELASIMKAMTSEWVGTTVDFGNSIALLEDPMEVVKTLAPYAISTHVKDMAVEEYADGFRLSEVPLGRGFLDLAAMVAFCRQYNSEINFNLEMITRDPLEIPCLTDNYWATFENLSASELARIMRMVKKNYSAPLPRVSQLSVDDRLTEEEKNNVACLDFSYEKLNLK